MASAVPTSVSWADALERPVAFAFSGGSSLGAAQVGMLEAVAEAGLTPDLVVGTSVGTLNGAVVAEHGDLGRAAAKLKDVWSRLRQRDVFPGGRAVQAVRMLTGKSLHPNRGLRRVIRTTLTSGRIEELAVPFGALATEVLTSHPRLFTDGPLLSALLASSALPGIYPPVAVDGIEYWDGGLSAAVPLRPARLLGAGSLVVFDVGDLCHRREAPRGVTHAAMATMSTVLRQRVLVEAPNMADELSVAYLPAPCLHGHSPLDFSRSRELMENAYALVSDFLAETEPPVAGRMAGAPHHHDVSPLVDDPRRVSARSPS